MFSHGAPNVFAPDAKVRGESIAQWTAEWWTKALQIPVHAADGVTILNPLLTDSAPSSQGNAGGVFFLFGSLFPGAHARTATVPSGTPILVPVLPVEFSNADTTTGNVAYNSVLMNLPGNNSAADLSSLAAQTADPAIQPGGSLKLSVDGVGPDARHPFVVRIPGGGFRFGRLLSLLTVIEPVCFRRNQASWSLQTGFSLLAKNGLILRRWQAFGELLVLQSVEALGCGMTARPEPCSRRCGAAGRAWLRPAGGWPGRLGPTRGSPGCWSRSWRPARSARPSGHADPRQPAGAWV